MSDSTDRPQAVAVRFKWKQQSDQHTLYTLPAEAGLKTQFFETYQQPLREHYGNFTVESAWHGVNRWELSHTFRLSIAGALAAAWSQSTDPTADETFQAAVEMALQKMQEAFPPPDWVESTLKLDPEEQSEAFFITAHTHLGVDEAMERLDVVQDWWVEQPSAQTLRPPILLTIRFAG
jgi:hypothetical protein